MPVGFAKSILISFNLILWLAGGTLIVLGTWIFVDPSKIYLFHFVTSDDLTTDFGYYLAYILIALGGFVLISGLFGCCGAVRENRCLLVAYFIFLFLLMCIELAVAIITLIYKDHFLMGLENRLANGLVHHYGYKNSNEKFLSFSEAVDFAQYKFKCCGIKSDDDYVNSNWRNESFLSVERRNVPLTCCISQDPGEVEEPWQNPYVKDDLSCQDPNEKVHVTARNKEGCIREIEVWFKKESTVLITVGLSSAALQIVGMIFALCLCKNLNSSI
ncbi:hypothetical protein RUM43_003344 [Polyplax serrata]|uniref:Tetraspanin n=1 Tax=Polyplax serrata TaxID=468196 RepID=A0AAN8S5H6_POLSC